MRLVSWFHAGLRAARDRERLEGTAEQAGRPEESARAKQLYDTGTDVATIRATLGIARPTRYRALSTGKDDGRARLPAVRFRRAPP